MALLIVIALLLWAGASYLKTRKQRQTWIIFLFAVMLFFFAH